jgi:hypothetical protein
MNMADDQSLDKQRPDNELGNVLVSLQKAFSRVSRDSASVPAHKARALVVGKVNFEMSVKCHSADDSLLVADDGGITLRLAGTLEVDVRPVLPGDHSDSFIAPSGRENAPTGAGEPSTEENERPPLTIYAPPPSQEPKEFNS